MDNSPEVTILMPKISDHERTSVRYFGLYNELAELGIEAWMAESHDSFNAEDGVFTTAYIPELDAEEQKVRFTTGGAFQPKLVRDLTMPAKPMMLYSAEGVALVHDPEFNAFVRDKSKVAELFKDLQPQTFRADSAAEAADAVHAVNGSLAVMKPITGMQSQGVVIGEKSDVVEQINDQEFAGPVLIQEFIESQDGITELNITGRHNYRVIMIGGAAIFGFARLVREGSHLVEDDSFRNLTFQAPDMFPDELLSAIDDVRAGIGTLPDGTNTVIAADLMRGSDASGESRMYLCELNRRPMRNSPYHGRDAGNMWASHRWDVHEAAMLASKLQTEDKV